MEIISIIQRLEDLPQEIHDKEVKMFEAKATYDYMGDLKKAMLAQLKIGFSGSNPERETSALASAEYKHHLEAIKQLAIEYGRATSKYHLKKNEFDSLRSQNSALNAR